MKNISSENTLDYVNLASIQAKISSRLHSFDIISILRLLAYLGYPMEAIRFESYNSLCSQPRLIQSIKFYDTPVRQVKMVMNMGLLSAQSSLPSYFQKEIDKGMIDVNGFYDFIGYFDHFQISQYFKAIHPELNAAMAEDQEVMKFGYTQMLDLRSCSTLHWLFKTVFPELEVSVEKCMLPRDITMTSLKLGKAILGENAVFGNKTTIDVASRKVTLFCMEESTLTGEPWPLEIKKRMKELVFPLLRATGINLIVTLIIKSQRQWVKLNKDSYLGYDKIRGGKDSFRQVRIFKGNISAI